MARDLIFSIHNKQFTYAPQKIERKKLYGWTETLALDDDGNEMKLVSMDESGTTIIPKGGIGLGMVNDSGNWVDKSEIMAVDPNGNPVEQLPSSFSAPIELQNTVSMEEFLDHSIVSVYELESTGEHTGLNHELAGNIYSFTFNYREGYEANPAFLMESEGKLFVLVGIQTTFPMIGLQEAGFLEEVEEEECSEDELDFSMM